MIFPVSGVEINPFVPPAVAFVISFFTSMGGVSGAFLLLPFQVSVLGFTSPSVSATNHVFNIVAIPSGVYRYIKEGRMVWPLTWAVIIGTLPGVFIGAIIRIRYLPDPKNFKLFVGLVLLYIGGKMLRELLRKQTVKKRQIAAEEDFRKRVQQDRGQQVAQAVEKREISAVVVKKFNLSRIAYEFQGQTFDVSTPGIMSLCLVVGIIGGVYGIGGGSIVAPFFISFFGLPVYTIAGAALMGTFVTSVAGVVFYQLIAPFYADMVIAPDWMLGFLFGVGGFAGMYCGARCQKFVSAKLIKWILVLCILFPAIRYLLAFVG